MELTRSPLKKRLSGESLGVASTQSLERLALFLKLSLPNKCVSLKDYRQKIILSILRWEKAYSRGII